MSSQFHGWGKLVLTPIMVHCRIVSVDWFTNASILPGKTFMTTGKTLTPKQSAFAGFVAEGSNYTDAYRKAYNAKKMTSGAIHSEAYKLAKNEKVSTQIKELKAQKNTAIKSHEKVHKSWVLERLQEEALDIENPASTRVRALELLGKSSGLFDDSTVVTIENRTPEQIERELQEKLGILFGVAIADS